MRLLRAATLSVKDPDATAQRYVDWLEYRILERGTVADDLAASWGATGAAGAPYVVVGPQSGREVFLRFVAGPRAAPVPPLRTFGWAAIELCVQDVLKLNERMLHSPFEIIGPPKELDGLPTIFPMQVRGPDDEIVYLTQIKGDLPEYDLPRARSFVDMLFIAVLACSDMHASLAWFERALGLAPGRDMAIEYTLLAEAFGMPVSEKHTLATMTHERDVFLECDQYPSAATARPTVPGALPPCFAIASFTSPNLERIKENWIRPPVVRQGAVYGGRRAGTLRAPDGTLVEVIAQS